MRLLKPHWVTHGKTSKTGPFLRPIYTLDIHPDGKRLATGGLTDGGGLIILWDMALIRNPSLEKSSTSQRLFQMDNHQACVNCVRWSPTGRWLASGGMDRVVMIWIKTSTGARASAIFGATEKMKFTEHWRCSTVLRHHTGDIIDIAWAQDGLRLASSSVDNTVVIWGPSQSSTSNTPSASPFQCIATLRGHGGPVKGVTWDPAGRYLATQSEDLGVRIWRVSDWQEESKISKPFVRASDQSQVTRLSWSPDGSVIVAPHAINNRFPTAQLINRNHWRPGLDLVGHEKHVVCARYNPNLLRKSTATGNSVMICLALGSKDRSVSVWTTLGRRAFLVVRDLFANSVSDLTWSSDGKELLACSLDGSISYMAFTSDEIGEPLNVSEVARLHRKTYGQSLLDSLSSDGLSTLGPLTCEGPQGVAKADASGVASAPVLLETPEALALQRSQAELRVKLDGLKTSAATAGSDRLAEKPVQPTNQTEIRTKDGRRRITPRFLGTLDSLDEEPQTNSNSQFASERVRSSSTDSKDNLICPSNAQGSTITPTAAEAEVHEDQHQPQAASENVATSLKPSTPEVSDNNSSLPPVALVVSSTPSAVPNASSARAQSPTPATAAPESPSPPFSGRKRKRSELTASPTQAVSSEKSVDKAQKRKRRRHRLFLQDEQTYSLSETAPSSSATSGGGGVGVGRSHSAKPGTPDKEAMRSISPPRPLHAVSGTMPPSRICLKQISAVGRTQFVCSNSVEGTVIVNVVNTPSAEGSKAHPASMNKVMASRGDKQIWELSNRDRFTAHAHTDTVIALGDCRGRLRLLQCSGAAICPPLILESGLLQLAAYDPQKKSLKPTCEIFKSAPAPPGARPAFSSYLDPLAGGSQASTDAPAGSSQQSQQQQQSSTNLHEVRLAAITATGCLRVWSLSIGSDRTPLLSGRLSTTLPQLLVESTLAGIVQPGDSGVCSSMEFTDKGHLVVRLVCGSCYLFNTDLRVWIELFDALDPVKCHAAISMQRSCPSGPLCSLQHISKLAAPKTAVLPLEIGQYSSAQRQSLSEFLECQMQGAELVGSPAEFKFWLLRWFRHLVEDGEDERIRQVCMEFIGPFLSASKTSWQPTIKGISKRSLVKELLALFALNLRMQRLYVELKELLEQSQET